MRFKRAIATGATAAAVGVGMLATAGPAHASASKCNGGSVFTACVSVKGSGLTVREVTAFGDCSRYPGCTPNPRAVVATKFRLEIKEPGRPLYKKTSPVRNYKSKQVGIKITPNRNYRDNTKVCVTSWRNTDKVGTACVTVRR
ncbi:hypothetical protein AR457_07640 [Streptomyces agglomeratus]|uniref:hypothetical protein n=1 Tax=Streptomyces agglomeratus TaxID=285458 RepID=UPI00085487D3|nr:hypothetical protein [Streptomyces agglomeratus]OEJ41626.1 hypothetical protein BGK70_29010 [Streptomyces agglomeratus]OEJ43995.1 hypothetical protein AR457_07640 [Streptomyces agglomeratus]OEJ61489.1 hypothetical protein BGM19_29230 [Streptomyces agglomeratus]